MQNLEKRVIEIDLPLFLVQFKDNCLNYLMFCLNNAIEYFQQTDNNLVVIIIVLIIVQLVRIGLMRDGDGKTQQNSQMDTRKLERQLKDLKKQIKSIQLKLHDLKGSINTNNPNHNQYNHPNNLQDASSIQKINQILKDSCQKRSQTITDLLSWQLKIIKEVTKLKNKLKGNKTISKSNISKNSYNKNKALNDQGLNQSTFKENKSVIINNEIQKPLFSGSKQNEHKLKQVLKVQSLSKVTQDQTIVKKDNKIQFSNYRNNNINIQTKIISNKEQIIKVADQKVIYSNKQSEIIQKSSSLQITSINQSKESNSFDLQRHDRSTIKEIQLMKDDNKVNDKYQPVDKYGQNGNFMAQSLSIQGFQSGQNNGVQFKPMKRPSPPKFTVPRTASSTLNTKKQGKRTPPPPPPRR